VTTEPTPTRQRDAALQQARVAYRAEHGRWPSRSWKLTPAAPPPANPQGEARGLSPFDAAYRGPEVGPVGATWPADPTGYSRYMVWQLPVHTPAPFRRNSF
jgi:hypothetical protein